MSKGLSQREAEKRLLIYGKNEIKKEKAPSPITLFLNQFKSPLILLLIFAALLAFFISEVKHESYFDSILILAIVFISGLAGFLQDWKAERTIEALQQMAVPKARVIRDGKEKLIDSTCIVPGDLLVINSGDVIVADSRIIEGDLELDESMLTGESKAVKKTKGALIYSGTSVYTGKALAEVIATGMKTELGKIAAKMQSLRQEQTPFQIQLKKFSKKLVGLTLLVLLITFLVGFKKFGFIKASLIAVSLAVAAIPEGLPAVITIALSLGARNMAKRNALVRRLAVTESIGTVQVICTDKTGTLTEGKMKVKEVWFLKYSSKSASLAVQCCFYCNDAKQVVEEKNSRWIGNETDIALKEWSKDKIKDKIKAKRIKEIHFSSERKLMSVLQQIDNKLIVFSKGAPEIILQKSTKAIKGEKIIKLDKKLKQFILTKNKYFAAKGYRILALAYKEVSKKSLSEKDEKDFIFIGLIVLADPPRKEVKKAIQDCYKAGIRVIMITGDNPVTAKAIAGEIGLKSKGVITGKELDAIDDKKLEKLLSKGINIFARTTPFHKLRILECLQKQDKVVAMTGDGVNDALALKKADVGISMGIRGTEVAREASDIILLDDNFATIRNAIKDGRRIFDNIRKFVDYLLTCNVAEVLVVLIATILFPFISLYPSQILWINLITDGLPAIALAVDPARPDVMKRKPRKKEEGIINKRLALLIGSIGVKKAGVVIGTFLIALSIGLGLKEARTVLFTGFIMYEFVRIAVIRYNEKLILSKYWLKNKFLVYALVSSFLLQLFIVYSPLSTLFNTVPLHAKAWLILISGTFVGFSLGIGIAKLIDKVTKEIY